MAMSSPSNPLNPTFEGHIASTIDALILFEACLSGQLNHVPRRPHDRERQDLIKSGNVFIYEEHASGIKRWTDGVSWSPSRILGNFLIYRELEKPFPPGEKKRALKKSKKIQQGVSKSDGSGGTSRPGGGSNSISGMGYPSSMDSNVGGKDTERALIGSLIDSYPFKTDGLVKKTISVSFQGVPHHLVSYYNVNDVMSGRLATPSKHAGLRNIIPRSELIMSQNFRAPIDEIECGAGDDRFGPHPMFGGLSGPHDFGGGSVLQRAMSMPSFNPIQMPQYGTGAPAAAHYGFAPQPPQQQQPQHHAQQQQQQHQPQHHTPQQHQQHPQHAFVSSMPPSASPMSFAPQLTTTQNNYALDPTRTTRFATSATMAHEFPRNMPSHSPPRRHSTFDAHPPADLSTISLSAMSDTRGLTGTPYLSNPSYYMPTTHRTASISGPDGTFPSPRMKPEPDQLVADDGGPQHYGLDDTGAAAWGFDAMNSTHDGQYLGGGSGDTQPWSNGPNSLGRT